MALPDSARADLLASTVNGRITCDFPLTLVGEITKRRMEGKINGGGPTVELRTTNGSISVGVAEGDELTEADIPALPSKPGMPALPKPPAAPSVKGLPNFLRIQIWEDGEQKFKITAPVSLAEQTLHSLPEDAKDELRDKGIDIGRLLNDITFHPKLGRLVEIQDDDKRVQIDLVVE